MNEDLIEEIASCIDDYIPGFYHKFTKVYGAMSKLDIDILNTKSREEIIDYIRSLASDYHDSIWDKIESQLFFFQENV